MSETRTNQQPLPRGSVDLGSLTEAVTAAVRNAMEQRAATPSTPQVFVSPRIIIGLIIEAAKGALE